MSSPSYRGYSHGNLLMPLNKIRSFFQRKTSTPCANMFDGMAQVGFGTLWAALGLLSLSCLMKKPQSGGGHGSFISNDFTYFLRYSVKDLNRSEPLFLLITILKTSFSVIHYHCFITDTLKFHMCLFNKCSSNPFWFVVASAMQSRENMSRPRHGEYRNKPTSLCQVHRVIEWLPLEDPLNRYILKTHTWSLIFIKTVGSYSLHFADEALRS